MKYPKGYEKQHPYPQFMWELTQKFFHCGSAWTSLQWGEDDNGHAIYFVKNWGNDDTASTCGKKEKTAAKYRFRGEWWIHLN